MWIIKTWKGLFASLQTTVFKNAIRDKTCNNEKWKTYASKCTPFIKMYIGNVLPPFPTTRLLRLTSIAKCDTWALVLKMYTRGLYQAQCIHINQYEIKLCLEC